MSKTTLSNSNASESHKKRVELLFSRFAAFYGHLWRSQFKSNGFLEFAKKEWVDGLSQFTDEVVNKATIECRDFYEMPPSLPQVIGICRGIRKRYECFVPRDEINKASPELAMISIKQCKSFLKL